MKYFCDFCDCAQCKYGWRGYNIYHAPTDDGKWICDVCYEYDQCTTGPNRNPMGPCKNADCEHRPKLIGGWIKQTKEEEQMCDTCKEHNPNVEETYVLPVDHPRTAAIAGWLYDHICEPVNKFIDWIGNGFTTPVKEEKEDDQNN